MLRPATEDDLDAIRRWRNHPKVRRASFTTHEISAEEHRRWWDVVRQDPSRRVLIYERAGVAAGVVTFSGLDGEVVEWSKYLDVDGIGSQRSTAWAGLEHEAIDYAFDVLDVSRLGAATLASNTPVLRLHQQVGFTEVRRYVRKVDGEPREVVWNELTRADLHR
jgi:UDP-4-amino-4,6-dideoxy-N-acetyl-beta-L-altrosamine N-acetyltransferase